MLCDTVKNYIAQCIGEAVREELQNPESRKEFEMWYFKKYNKPYDWNAVKLSKEKIDEIISNKSDDRGVNQLSAT